MKRIITSKLTELAGEKNGKKYAVSKDALMALGEGAKVSEFSPRATNDNDDDILLYKIVEHPSLSFDGTLFSMQYT